MFSQRLWSKYNTKTTGTGLEGLLGVTSTTSLHINYHHYTAIITTLLQINYHHYHHHSQQVEGMHLHLHLQLYCKSMINYHQVSSSFWAGGGHAACSSQLSSSEKEIPASNNAAADQTLRSHWSSHLSPPPLIGRPEINWLEGWGENQQVTNTEQQNDMHTVKKHYTFNSTHHHVLFANLKTCLF